MIALTSDAGSLTAIPAARYTYDELADIYNASRVDYIVPMPMNAKRMAEYVSAYSVDLEGSFVVLNADSAPTGVGMLGWRERRGWITRLGVIPERRGRRVGQFVLESLLNAAQERGAVLAQLEVIEGNEPAHRLFLKLGFEETRRLVVLRRPPGALPVLLTTLHDAQIEPLDALGCLNALSERDLPVSWLEEADSMRRLGSLEGLSVKLRDGMAGAVIFCRLPFQLSHITPVAPPDAPPYLLSALVAAVHRHYPKHDTKLENLDANSRFVPAFQMMGYLESFRRVEMIRRF